MSIKQPLISLDRPNNASALNSLQTPEPTPTSDLPAAIEALSANDAAPRVNGTVNTVAKAPRKPARAGENASVQQTAAAVPTVVSVPTPAPGFEKIVALGTRIPASLHQNIKLYCVANGIEMQQFVQEAITNHLTRLQGK